MQAVLGIGSNLGDRENNIALALDLLERLPDGSQKLSSLYETEPFDVISRQDRYLNCCVLLETKLAPEELWTAVLPLKRSWGEGAEGVPRCKDYGYRRAALRGIYQLYGKTDRTPSPYPRAAFVMVPLSDLFPAHDALGFSFHDAYEAVEKKRCKALSLGTS